ncbi:MAG: TetR/AcrR family transcriptional regulator [Xanthomonadales bacterium]|nr:TetR/AcrR family transcriptional regulator [Xanthomonadales bacterium]
MSPRQTDTREQIIERARDLLQSRGIEGFSYRDISTHLGIKNAAVHYHFPSKNDLGVALIEQFTDEIRGDMEEARRHQVSPTRQLEAYFHRSEHEVDDGCQMCAFGALAASFERLPEELQAAVTELRKLIHGWLAETLEAGRDAGEFRFSGSATGKAMQIGTAIQGARQMSIMTGSNVVRQVADGYREELYTRPEEN